MNSLWDAIVIRESEHRGNDDLLTAGLGASGIRDPRPPGFIDPALPTAQEQRRRAIYSNWRGIAHVATADIPGPVPGRELHAQLKLPGARHGHRVMLQLPDAFDPDARCLLVTAASGSRGIYGAMAVASAWGLPRGCAVVSTDKGAGCDWFDQESGSGFALDGTLTERTEACLFVPEGGANGRPGVAIAHAHSGDNPEADWGWHLRQAAEFGLAMLERLWPTRAPWRVDNTRIIAVGLSNAGAAVLRAAEQQEPWLAGAVAVAPNIHPPVGGRPLYDYATEAALWLSAAQAAPELADAPLPLPLLSAEVIAQQRERAIAALQAHRLLPVGSLQSAAQQALQHVRQAGWSVSALRAATLSSAFDMWRAVGVGYASAYGRFGIDQHPCGYRYGMLDADGQPRTTSAVERALWWSDGAGIVPGAGVDIAEPTCGRSRDHGANDAFLGLVALRALWDGAGIDADRVRAGIAATRAALPRAGLPLLVIHGSDDGLIPEAFSSLPYVQACRAAGRNVAYWPIERAQHFDGMLGLPEYAARHVPLLPWVHVALDALWAHLLHGAELPQVTPSQADCSQSASSGPASAGSASAGPDMPPTAR